MREQDTVDSIPRGSGAEEPEAGSKVKMLKSAIKKYYLIRDTSFNDLGEEYELEPGSVLTEKVDLVLTDPPYSTRGAGGQSGSAHDVVMMCFREEIWRMR